MTNAVLPGGARLTVKCLRCKDTYDVEGATVSIDAIVDDDSGEFVQYDVEFTDEAGSPLYIQDLLCLPKYCSVFGRLPNGSMFAFPWLTPGKKDNWHSRPDSRGDHYAMRGAQQ